MPTDVPLSARSLGPSAGLLSAQASTAEFLHALKRAEEQRERELAGQALEPWAGPTPPPSDCPAGRASAQRDRVSVVTEEAT